MVYRSLWEERKRWEGVELFKEFHDREKKRLGFTTEKEYIDYLLSLEQAALDRMKKENNNG